MPAWPVICAPQVEAAADKYLDFEEGNTVTAIAPEAGVGDMMVEELLGIEGDGLDDGPEGDTRR